MEGDDRTFRVDFSSEGVSTLRERVKEELKKFIGDYTDDVLVEYVIILLKNGKCKDEAKSELNVFLGDESDAFVSWLWDHLGYHISLYEQPQEVHPDADPKTGSTTRGQAEETDSHYILSDAEKGNSNETSGNNLSLEHEGLVRNREETEVHAPRKSASDNDHSKDESDRRVVCIESPLSPSRAIQKQRRQTNEPQAMKGGMEVSHSTVTAPKRLLQIAVRDAVTRSRPSNSTTEPPPKRLRSVVPTLVRDLPLLDRHRRIPHSSMSAVNKAMSEAVKDVTKVKSSCSVFDRLGHVTDGFNARRNTGYVIGAEDVYGGDLNMVENFQYAYNPQNDIDMLQEENLSSFHDTITGKNSWYDGKDYYDVYGRGTRATTIGSFSSGGNGVDKPLTIQVVVGGTANAKAHKSKRKNRRYTRWIIKR